VLGGNSWLLRTYILRKTHDKPRTGGGGLPAAFQGLANLSLKEKPIGRKGRQEIHPRDGRQIVANAQENHRARINTEQKKKKAIPAAFITAWLSTQLGGL